MIRWRFAAIGDNTLIRWRFAAMEALFIDPLGWVFEIRFFDEGRESLSAITRTVRDRVEALKRYDQYDNEVADETLICFVIKADDGTKLLLREE